VVKVTLEKGSAQRAGQIRDRKSVARSSLGMPSPQLAISVRSCLVRLGAIASGAFASWIARPWMLCRLALCQGSWGRKPKSLWPGDAPQARKQ